MKRIPWSTVFWVGLALVFTVIGTIGAWLKYHQPHLLLVWKPFILTQHQFDYEGEFVKRGLVGEGFRWLGVARNVTAVSIFSWGILVILAAALVRFHRRCSVSHGEAALTSPSTLWLLTVFVCPATFMQAGGDLGRLDPVLLLCEIGLLLQAMAPGWRWTPVAIMLTWVGVATHELFLLAQLPLVLGVHVFLGWHRAEFRKELWGRALAIMSAAVIAAGCVAAFGRMDGTPVDEYMAFLQQHRGLPEPSVEGVAVLYNSLDVNINFAWEKLAAKAPWRIPVAAAVLLSYLGLSIVATRRQRTHMLLIAVGAMGPLLLLLLAYDYGRWFSFSTINILLAVSICQQNGAVAVNWKPLRWTWAFALLGPFGVTIGFPWWQ